MRARSQKPRVKGREQRVESRKLKVERQRGGRYRREQSEKKRIYAEDST
jgi:hypothetical protein